MTIISKPQGECPDCKKKGWHGNITAYDDGLFIWTACDLCGHGITILKHDYPEAHI